MIPSAEPFLAMIFERPDDDGPRLVYADWLEERGECDRSEFIRVQCDLAKMPEPEQLCIGLIGPRIWENERLETCPRCRAKNKLCDYHLLQRRERELLDKHGRDWSPGYFVWTNDDGTFSLHFPAPFEGHPEGVSACEGRFRRGFVEWLACRWEDWSAHADAILAEHPVQEVTLTTEPVLFWQTDTKNRRDVLQLENCKRVYYIAHHKIDAQQDYIEFFRRLKTRMLCNEWPRIHKWNLPPSLDVDCLFTLEVPRPRRSFVIS